MNTNTKTNPNTNGQRSNASVTNSRQNPGWYTLGWAMVYPERNVSHNTNAQPRGVQQRSRSAYVPMAWGMDYNNPHTQWPSTR